jgi:hypothetical protein
VINNFCNYAIIDFIFEISKNLSQKTKINSIEYEIAFFDKYDFNFIVLLHDTDYFVAIQTDMHIDNCVVFNQKSYYVKKYKNNENFKIYYRANNKKTMSYNFSKAPLFIAYDTVSVKKYFSKDSFLYINNHFNLNYINYLKNIPFCFYTDSIFEVPISTIEMQKNIEEIEKIILKLSDIEKINFLLRTCQYIEHVDDVLTYNAERLLMPEVTLFLNTGDCDDKSLLFSFFIYKILKYQTVLIMYPNGEHMNVGVEINESDIGDKDFIEIQNRKFIICEPSGLWHEAGKQIDSVDISCPVYVWPVFH